MDIPEPNTLHINFREDPEETLRFLLSETAQYYESRREMAREIAEIWKSEYPERTVSAVTITFWIAWAEGRSKQAGRVPSLANGTHLFEILYRLRSQRALRQALK